MITIYIKNKPIKKVKNWDTALHQCAKYYKQGTSISDIKLIKDTTGEELPIKIKHLIL